jgi:putative oxidoreductase
MTQRLNDLLVRFEGFIHHLLVRYSVGALRVTMGVIFLGFGVLKFFPHVSPAQNLVEATIAKMTDGRMPGELGLLITAVLECAIGISLITGKWLRLTVYLLFFEILGILSPIVLLPNRIFSGPDHAPNLAGQYVLKDIVLAAGAMVIATRFRGARITEDETWEPPIANAVDVPDVAEAGAPEPVDPNQIFAVVVTEEMTGDDAEPTGAAPLLIATISTATWELNVHAPAEDLMSLRGAGTERWEDRGSLAVGHAAGAPVLWSCDGDAGDVTAIVSNGDVELWSLAVTMPARVIADIVAQAAEL